MSKFSLVLLFYVFLFGFGANAVMCTDFLGKGKDQVKVEAERGARETFEAVVIEYIVKQLLIPSKKQDFLAFASSTLRQGKKREAFSSFTSRFTKVKPVFQIAEIPYSNFETAVVYIFENWKSTTLPRDRDPRIEKFVEAQERRLKTVMARFFKDRLRRPRRTSKKNELAKAMGISQKLFELMFTSARLREIWKESVVENAELMEDAKGKLMQGLGVFLRQVGTPQVQRVTRREPNAAELFEALTRHYKQLKADREAGDYEEKHVQRLLGEYRGKDLEEGFETPRVFEGIEELIRITREKSPHLFAGFVSAKYDKAYHEATIRMIESKKGFLVTSITDGIPIKLKQLEAMLKYVEEHDMVILVGVVNGETNYIDNLLNNPRVRIVTKTLDLGPELDVSSYPIQAKLMNPDASVNARHGFTKPTIIFGPQHVSKILPSTENHLRNISLWVSGSLSENLAPYSNAVSARVSWLAEQRHMNGFLVVEKTSKNSGIMETGVRGEWHIRNVEYIDHANDAVHGFTDKGVVYTPKGRQDEKPRIAAIVLGDFHNDKTDLLMLDAVLERVIPIVGAPKFLLFQDALDNTRVNELAHHEKNSTGKRSRSAQGGRLSVVDETNSLNHSYNELQVALPETTMVQTYANHHVWLDRFRDMRMVDPLNQMIVDQLSFAQTSGGKNIFEFLFNIGGYRSRLINASDAHVREALDGQFVDIYDPARIKVLERGEPFYVGPAHRRIALHHHGHEGSGGARAGDNTHRDLLALGTLGDSHSPGIYGGVHNVGTMTYLRLDYNRGGYNRWGKAIDLIYNDGTRQLLIYNAAAGRFFLGPKEPFRKADHFTRKPEVILNTNDVFTGSLTDPNQGGSPLGIKR